MHSDDLLFKKGQIGVTFSNLDENRSGARLTLLDKIYSLVGKRLHL